MPTPERRIVLTHRLAPGDESCLTALVRDIKLTHKDRYAIDVRVNFDTLWHNNPWITRLDTREKGVEEYRISYREGIP